MVRFLSPYSAGESGADQNKPIYPTGLFLVFLILLFIFLAAYLGVRFWYNPYLNVQIDEKDKQIQEIASRLSAEQKEELMDFYSRIGIIKNLLSTHLYASNFLNKLESLNHPKVSFSNLQINMKPLNFIPKLMQKIRCQRRVFTSRQSY